MEDDQTWSFRGSKSRNKVSVGEPAEGSLTRIQRINPMCTCRCSGGVRVERKSSHTAASRFSINTFNPLYDLFVLNLLMIGWYSLRNATKH